MKMLKKSGFGGLLALALSALGGRTWAASTTTAVLNIDVTVNASVGVLINGVTSSTAAETVTPGGASQVSATSATVTSNATGGILEYWKLSSSNTADNSGGAANWALATSTAGVGAPGVNQFAIQGVFVSSNVSAGAGGCQTQIPAADWNGSTATPLGFSPAYYRSASFAGGPMFADGTVIGGSSGQPDVHDGTSGDGRMQASGAGGVGQRGFCYRITPPTSVTTADNQIIYVTVTASSS